MLSAQLVPNVSHDLAMTRKHCAEALSIRKSPVAEVLRQHGAFELAFVFLHLFEQSVV